MEANKRTTRNSSKNEDLLAGLEQATHHLVHLHQHQPPSSSLLPSRQTQDRGGGGGGGAHVVEGPKDEDVVMEEGGLEYLQQRMEELKQEKEAKLVELDIQKRQFLQSIDHRFDAERQQLDNQLEADTDEVKKTLVKSLQLKKRKYLEPHSYSGRDKIRTRSNSRRNKKLRRFPQSHHDILWRGSNGSNPFLKSMFNNTDLNEKVKSGVLNDMQAEQDIALIQQPFRAHGARRPLPFNMNPTPLPSTVQIMNETLHYFGEEFKVSDCIVVHHVDRQYRAKIESITKSEIKLKKVSGGNTRIWAMHLKNRKTSIRHEDEDREEQDFEG